MLALQNKNFEFAKIFIELFNKKLDIKHSNGFNIFDYAFKNGSSLSVECIEFINTMLIIYDKVIDDQFLTNIQVIEEILYLIYAKIMPYIYMKDYLFLIKKML
jgi:hypothetical protein